MTTEQFGRYEIRKRLGKGGMATVYLAYDPRFDREVALKVLPEVFLHNDNFRQRFEREARIIARLEHKAIVPVYDFGEHRGQPYLVMRHMAGDSLSTKLEEQPKLTSNEILKIVQRIASALDEAHRHGIIHRDLKPGNILFDQYGDAYLADFGIAKLGEATASLTGNTIVGTPAYMSPEQVHGRKSIDGRSDIYTLGIILYQLLTGEVPYYAETPVQQMMAHVLEPVPELPHVANWEMPEDCSAIIKKALAKEPDERHRTASELAKDLSEVLQIELDEIDEVDRAPITPAQRPKPASAVDETRHINLGTQGNTMRVSAEQYEKQAGTASVSSPQPNTPLNGPTHIGQNPDTINVNPSATIINETTPPQKAPLSRWKVAARIGLAALLFATIAFFILPAPPRPIGQTPALIDYEENIRNQLSVELHPLFYIQSDALLREVSISNPVYPIVTYETAANPNDVLRSYHEIAIEEGFADNVEFVSYDPQEKGGYLFVDGLTNDRSFDMSISDTERDGIYEVALIVINNSEIAGLDDNSNFEVTLFENEFLAKIDPSLRPLFLFPPDGKLEDIDIVDPMSPMLEIEIYRPADELRAEYQNHLEENIGLTLIESVSPDEMLFELEDNRLLAITFEEEIGIEPETKITMVIEQG